jgi:chromosomal replication initiator protein
MPPTEDTNLWDDLLTLPENRSAVRAAERVVRGLQRPSGRTTAASPLLFHGPAGVGKSAIVQAITRRAMRILPARTVRLLPATQFPRASDESPEELQELRHVDLLAIEDLQHLREPDQEEFQAVLDHRVNRRRPTLITASLGPAHLTSLPRRLTSRLCTGLVVRIDPPTVESRRYLAHWIAGKRGLSIDADALAWIAETATGIRPLFGMLEKLRALSRGHVQAMDRAKVMAALQEPVPESGPMERIMAAVCDAFRVKERDLTGPSRLRTVLVPRQVAMYLAREVGRLPLMQIGDHFGGRDHTTVMNALSKLEATLKKDRKLAEAVRVLIRGFG